MREMPRLVAIASIFFISVLVLGAGRPHRQGALVPSAGPAAVGEVIVGLNPIFASLPDDVLALRLNADVIERMPEIGGALLGLRSGETPAEAIERMQGLPQVGFVEPNLLLRSASAPNDPLYATQTPYLDAIDAAAAWDIELGKNSVLVAVLDSGIDLTHPDLQGKIWTNPLETPGNGLDDDNDGCVDDIHGCNFVASASVDPSCSKSAPPDPVTDDNGHGTFVAGIIAATGNNRAGITGAAPGVTILPVKILDCTGGGTAAQAAQAILYAARVGARVVNISFGADGESQTLANAIKEAHDKYQVVIVAPTGNDGERGVTFPARLPQTIAVASSGIAGDPNARSPFSDWGPEVAVAAPGLNIISTVPQQFCNTWTCLDSGPYAIASGTSFAAPFVSALAALVISHTPDLPADTVRQIIVGTALHLPEGDTPNWNGNGRIEMKSALQQPRYVIGVPGATRP